MLSRVEVVPGDLDERLAALPDPWVGGHGPLLGRTGAWLEFRGVVRDREVMDGAEVEVTGLDYEAHPEMAVHQMEVILRRIAAGYPVSAMLVLHRVGRVPVGEASLLVRVLSRHRGEALAACAAFVDELKQRVPIWKHAVRP